MNGLPERRIDLICYIKEENKDMAKIKIQGEVDWSKVIERPRNVPTLEEIMEYKNKGYKYEDIPRSLWDMRE